MPRNITCEICGEQFEHVGQYVVHQLHFHSHEEMIETYYRKPMQEARDDENANSQKLK